MYRWFLTVAVGFFVFAFVPDAKAVIILFLENPFDESKALEAIREDKRVLAFRRDIDGFSDGLLRLKERDFHALFGKPVEKKSEEYTMSIAGPRCLGLSGLHYTDPKKNKDHIDFHCLDDHGGVEIYYQINGETPAAIILYFRIDKDFPRLRSAKGLDNRLCWERQHFTRLVRYFESRQRVVFEWEVDEAAERKLYQDEESLDLKVKLAAWIKAGERACYRLASKPGTEYSRPEWKWYGPGNRLLWQARHDRGFKGAEALASEFIRFHPNGNPARKESGWPEIQVIWWYREDGTLVRCEGGSQRQGRWRAIDWTWYDKSGKDIRCERDTNGDGLPDTLKGKPLAVKDSWAIHPNLIPKDNTLPELRERRVPLRKISE
jgi:hypothetical protein